LEAEIFQNDCLKKIGSRNFPKTIAAKKMEAEILQNDCSKKSITTFLWKKNFFQGTK